jgi:hypothetical protein
MRIRTVVPLQHIVDFGVAMLESRDIDPIYPLLEYLYRDRLGETPDREERALWQTVLYVAFYNLPSALTAYREIGWPETSDLKLEDRIPVAHLSRLPIGTERRGLRGGMVTTYLQGYWRTVRRHGGNQERWMQQGWGDAPPLPEWRYNLFWDTWQQVKYNGRWSAFKTAEILSTVHRFPMAAPDMRMAHCSGPREGLIWLYDLDLSGMKASDRVKYLDGYGLHLRRQLADRGLPLSWEQLETVLCNFNSMRQGKYYVGHDIDELQGQIEAATAYLHPGDEASLWKARRAVIPCRYLGEGGGWSGVQHARMRVYLDEGHILTRSG